jgi:stage V sporulation protein SpoVS
MPRHALNQEAIARNLHAKEGVTLEEYIPAFRNALVSKEEARHAQTKVSEERDHQMD